jgi:hypothetical protein
MGTHLHPCSASGDNRMCGTHYQQTSVNTARAKYSKTLSGHLTRGDEQSALTTAANWSCEALVMGPVLANAPPATCVFEPHVQHRCSRTELWHAQQLWKWRRCTCDRGGRRTTSLGTSDASLLGTCIVQPPIDQNKQLLEARRLLEQDCLYMMLLAVTRWLRAKPRLTVTRCPASPSRSTTCNGRKDIQQGTV